MVDAQGLQAKISSIGQGLLTGGAIIIIVLIAVAIVIILALWLRYKRKFDIETEIVSERSGDNPITFTDKAAILTDKTTKAKYFKLWYERVELPVPLYNIIERVGKKDRIKVWKKSEDEYIFLVPARIDKNLIMKQDGKIFRLASQKYIPFETNINYWNIKRKGQHKKLFDTESTLMKILPYIPHIVGGMFTIMILYILLNYLPAVLGVLKEVILEMKNLRLGEVVYNSTYG